MKNIQMRVLHTYCLNYNIGDYALGIGVKNLLRNYLDIDYIGNTNIQGRKFDEYYINEVVNKKYDLLVIGGGGIIHGAHWPNGWFWLIDKDLISKIKIPFIVYGVGYNYWEEEGGIPEKGKKHLEETFKNAAYFSVRNDGSHDRLYKQTEINAHVLPDPGFHIALNTEYERFENQKYVIIQLANDKPLSRFGSTEKIAKFVSEMRSVTKDLSQRYKVIFAPHVIDDVSLSKEICQDIENTEVLDFGKFAFDHSDQMIGYYKYAEFVLAMRGHGQILPIGFNTPVIALENHPKHRGLMKELGLLEYNVKIDDEDFVKILKSKVSLLEENRNPLIEQYKQINKDLILNSEQAFTQIKREITK
ncbi:polysaccharide pyruvyl transferase family protein [Kaistella daneshvariae]|uniref:Polysaccharide pyruvyl transferase family protein n=1 Tax=Kaistella daneshvariae TaxID=2487074 RepID=A0ABM7C6N4_9FLAO|nr:polysaccharide pyruvyl transferase family protein [Kaistella daneshvariae]AZI66634.1 polysaccharide pyruvyl transferase family protein [Kaistella daneshvariae]